MNLKEIFQLSLAPQHTLLKTYILVVNEGLWLGPNMKHSLLNPNQMRYNGVTVHDNPFDSHHELSIEHDDVTLPLTVSGTNIFLDTRTPTQHELRVSV
jgi:hypothetical protein